MCVQYARVTCHMCVCLALPTCQNPCGPFGGQGAMQMPRTSRNRGRFLVTSGYEHPWKSHHEAKRRQLTVLALAAPESKPSIPPLNRCSTKLWDHWNSLFCIASNASAIAIFYLSWLLSIINIIILISIIIYYYLILSSLLAFFIAFRCFLHFFAALALGSRSRSLFESPTMSKSTWQRKPCDRARAAWCLASMVELNREESTGEGCAGCAWALSSIQKERRRK